MLVLCLFGSLLPFLVGSGAYYRILAGGILLQAFQVMFLLVVVGYGLFTLP